MNAMKNFENFLEQLECYRDIYSNVKKHLNLFEKECDSLIEKISNCSSFRDAQEYFDSLHEIQRNLSLAKYKFEFPLSDRLGDLAYYLDRDDVYSRRHWYEKFKNGLKWPIE